MSPDGFLHPINNKLVDENNFVSEIINPTTKCCIISVKDARVIKAMLVGGGSETDRLVWPL